MIVNDKNRSFQAKMKVKNFLILKDFSGEIDDV